MSLSAVIRSPNEVRDETNRRVSEVCICILCVRSSSFTIQIFREVRERSPFGLESFGSFCLICAGFLFLA